MIKRRTEKEVVTMLPHGVVKSEMGADRKELAMQMQMSFDFPFTKDYKTFYMKQKYRADTYQAGFVFQCTAFRPDFRPERS